MVNEIEIIEAIRGGADRYEELVRRYHKGLIIHCEQLLGDRDEAEDMAQEAFVKAYLGLEKYDAAKARFSTWLYKIATNLCLDHLRRQYRKLVVEDIEALAEATMPTFLKNEEQQEVRQAVLALMPPEYRQAIEAYYWQGRSYQQIADDAGVPINTIRTRLRRAKLQLKESLS
jgi:RNA polymerase sigma-70 factor (ECF subfamily)